MFRFCPLFLMFAVLLPGAARAQDQDVASEEERSAVPLCQVLPLAEHQVSLQVEGVEKTRWHFGNQYPRPFFFPLNGPSGVSLTRMGHPGAPNHDHHSSLWFAHHDVNGHSFWANEAGTQIRQQQWLAYEDSDQAATMAVELGWFDAEGQPQMQQQIVASLSPLPDGETLLEIQTTLSPAANSPLVTLGKTNFGVLAVRVARSLSVHFGGGQIQNSEGAIGEQAIFAQPARWMDYSGPVAAGAGSKRSVQIEGITYFDHPTNPGYPNAWHVRSDGWMGAALCLNGAIEIPVEKPLTLRYLLYLHRDACPKERIESLHDKFSKRSGWTVQKSSKPHQAWEVRDAIVSR